MSNIIQLLTGEVAIRTHHVSIYFSLDEWDYIKGNKDLYEEGIKESAQKLHPLEYEDQSNITANLECYNNKSSKTGAVCCADENLTNPKPSPIKQPQPKNGIKEEASSCDLMCMSQPKIHILHGRTGCCELDEAISKNKVVVKDQNSSKKDKKPLSCTDFRKCFKKGSQGTLHHGRQRGKMFCCSECGNCFSDQSQLHSHQRVHKGERPFLRSQSRKPFRQKSNLRLHKRIPAGKKQLFCADCGKHFMFHSLLVAHQKIHTGEKSFSCSECGRRFTQISGLIVHQRIHTGEKPFSCSECGRSFTQMSGLNAHKRIHTGEKPFSCSECGRCFTQTSGLNAHKRTHTGEKPFSCAECGKRFMQISGLNAHKSTHTGEKTYCCSECGKYFARHTTLLAHQRIHMR
ncbi:oocyte zinc finger protein XlCOF6.1-like [Xenopus laevis]|uniref:Oocyte zinc finger protein XlCOF6.1-like n=1 Tax=Xenopus laevis TaxID=8355 RepID=A0A8J1LSL9_XENLA|nr:oocyte zinc finger protein XlCOF6.1-like [Xenopus laevis]